MFVVGIFTFLSTKFTWFEMLPSNSTRSTTGAPCTGNLGNSLARHKPPKFERSRCFSGDHQSSLRPGANKISSRVLQQKGLSLHAHRMIFCRLFLRKRLKTKCKGPPKRDGLSMFSPFQEKHAFWNGNWPHRSCLTLRCFFDGFPRGKTVRFNDLVWDASP